jgi:hypothetical protein
LARRAARFRKAGPGRPKGSRQKLAENFLAVLAADFAEHGKGVIERLRIEQPGTYTKVIASLLPKQIEGADGGPLLNSIVMTYRKPGDPVPEPEAVGAAVIAMDEATADPEDAEHTEAA